MVIHVPADQPAPIGFADAALKYSAFISYNHQDRAVARWLHRTLENYRIPRRLRGRQTRLGVLGARIPPVFRDREELAAASDLAKSVRDALEASASLVVICSPNGAKSRWVNEEVRTFSALGRRDQIQCLIVAGVPNASRMAGGDPAQECLPAALFEGGGAEPLAADIRPGGEGRSEARLKLLAGIADVALDELRQREQARRMRRLLVASSLMAAGLVITSGLATAAILARDEALHQRDIAREKTMTAERTVDFVKSLFEVSDPSETKGRAITAREILDRGATRINQSLADEPSVKAELSTTLGEVYAALGFFKEGQALIEGNLSLPHVDPASRARQYIALGEARSRAGDYNAAAASFGVALRLAEDRKQPHPEFLARILDDLGEARSGNGDDAAADGLLRRALALDVASLGPGHPDVARDLEALAVNAVFANRLGDGRRLLDRAVAIRRKQQGELHPKVAEDLMNLGSIAYLQRDSRAAEAYYQRALSASLKVLDPDHPDVALLQNNLGRLLIERRAYSDARPLLEHAVSVVAKERGETYDDMAFDYDNLALIRRGMGDLAGAEAMLRKGLIAAKIHKHRNLAPIMVDLADARCARGATKDGFALLNAARPIMAKVYPNDPWRTAWLDTIRGECLLAAGQRTAARNVLAASQPVIARRWPPETMYGARTQDLVTRASAELPSG